MESYVKRKEMAGHAIAGVGLNLVYGLWSGYMLVFYTDIFGISAAAASTIMMLTRFWDGANDPMMGMIADHTHTRWGRYRPWLFLSVLPVTLALVLNFSSPDLPPVGKVLFAAVTYVFMSMAFTSADVPYWSMPAAMTRDVNKRTEIISLSRGSGTIALNAVGIVIVPLATLLGNGDMKSGYFRTAFVLAFISALCCIIGFSCVREHVEPVQVEKIGLKKSVRVIFRNKPLLQILICYLCSQMGILIRQSLQVYYAQYNMGDINLVPLLSFLSLPGLLVGVVMTPLLSKRLGQKRLFLTANILGILMNVFLFIVGCGKLKLFLCILTLAGIPGGITLICSSAMIASTIEYAEWKFGQRSEGIISSTQTLSTKLATAFGTGLCGVILTMTGYVANVQQSAETLSGIHFSYTLLIAIISVIGLIPMFFFELTEERYAQIVKEIELRKVGCTS